MTAPVWMASPPEVHSTLLNSGPGPAALLAAAGSWSTLSAEYTAVAAELGAILAAVQAGGWVGPSAERYVAAHLPYQVWLAEAGAASAAAATRHQTLAGAYATAAATMPTLAELAANHSAHAVLVATNFFGINTVPIALNEADYTRMWIQAAATMTGYQAISDMTLAAAPHPAAAPRIVAAEHTAEQDPWDEYTNPGDPRWWVARVEELGSQFQTFGKELLADPARAFSYLVQLMEFDWPTHIAQIVTWLVQSPQLLSVAIGMAAANLGWAAGLAGLAGLGQPVPVPAAAAEPAGQAMLGAAGAAPAAAPAGPVVAGTPSLAAPALPASPASAAPAVPAGLPGFGYLAGGGGPGTTFDSTRRARAAAQEAEPAGAAGRAQAAARSTACTRARARRRGRTASHGFADEYLDLTADTGTAAPSVTAAGVLGFAGTGRHRRAALVTGLTQLTGGGCGAAAPQPMLPGTWADDGQNRPVEES